MMTFKKGFFVIQSFEGRRQRGRPRASWVKEVGNHVRLATIELNEVDFQSSICNAEAWKQLVRNYCRNLHE